MTKVKICGITNLEDALLSAKFGADALGFNFYEKSPRYITPEKAREIVEQLPAEVLKVGVFVNESLNKIVEIASIAKLDALQLHGVETPEYARELKAKTNLEIIKAFRVSPEFKPEDVLQYETDAILLDAYNPQEHGGTGETFDWEIAKKVQEIFPKMYLAGGISETNIRTAIRYANPFSIDTCSRIEKSKGKKDKVKIINLIKRAKNYDKTKNVFELKTEKILNIYDLIDAIQPAPALFIEKHSISNLKIYLDGFRIAFDILEKKFDWKDFYDFNWQSNHTRDDFQTFLTNYFNEDFQVRNWSYFILEKAEFDEEDALELFFALLEEFKLKKEDLGEI